MSKPNILLISIDTLRADHLSCYGYHHQTSPHIDAIAAEGMKFSNAHTTAVWTPPAHASMLTGLYPSQHGVVGNKRLKEQIPTIGEVLANHGYETVGFVNNPAVGRFVGLDRGHSEFHEIWKGVTSRNIIVRGGHFLYRSGLELFGIVDHGAKETNKYLKRWLIRRGKSEKPFYMFLHYIEPHNPINAPHPFKSRFVEPGILKGIDKRKLAKVSYNPLICYTDDLTLNEIEISYLQSLYDGEISYVDAMVGEVIELLRKSDLLDETMIIITADHGEHFGEKNLYSHVASLYEPILHIPLIIRFSPAYQPSSISDKPVQLVDVFPTILKLTNIEDHRLSNLPGKSLLPHSGQIVVDKERPIIAEWEGRIPEFINQRLRYSQKTIPINFMKKRSRMISIGNEKYILREDNREELYNLEKDPHEMYNLALQKKGRCTILREILMKRLHVDSTTHEDLDCEMDEIVRHRLHGLGYI